VSCATTLVPPLLERNLKGGGGKGTVSGSGGTSVGEGVGSTVGRTSVTFPS
jgi:hypothetical protein